MEITGRLTSDATVTTTKGEKKVVNFTIAVNDYFKTKSGEQRVVTEFVNCAYWLSDKIAASLKKGKLVGLYGRISARAWNNSNGEAVAGLNFHTSNIKFLGGASKGDENNNPVEDSTKKKVGETDDLPF